MQSLSIHMWVLPAKLPSLKWNKPSCQQQSVGLHGGRFHVFCAGISHSSAVGKELQLLLTAMSCNSSFCSQWPETLKSLEMPKITLPACLLTSGSTCTAIPPGTHTAKHHTALWSKKHPKFLHTEGKKKRAEQKDEGMEGWRSRVCTGARRRQHNRWKGWRKDYPMWRQERVREVAPCTAPFCHCWTVLGVLPDSDLADNLATPPGSPKMQDYSLGHGTNDTDWSKGLLEPTVL